MTTYYYDYPGDLITMFGELNITCTYCMTTRTDYHTRIPHLLFSRLRIINSTSVRLEMYQVTVCRRGRLSYFIHFRTCERHSNILFLFLRPPDKVTIGPRPRCRFGGKRAPGSGEVGHGALHTKLSRGHHLISNVLPRPSSNINAVDGFE
jgi:hypothetical protein